MGRDYFEGYLCIQVTGNEIGRFMNLCANKNIRLWDIYKEEEHYCMKLYLSDFFLLKNIVKKTGSKVKIIEKQGLIFWLKKQAKRKIFIAGPFLCLFLLFLLSKFLWAVEVSGNERMTEDVLQDFLQKQGVHYGMLLQDVPIQEIKTNLRREFDYITWASVSLDGTKLQIRLKENDVAQLSETEEYGSYNIVAHADGTVSSILTRTGTPLVKKGDQVKKGDILIEGKVSIPDQDGTIKREEYCVADGDVWINYILPVETTIEWEYEHKIYSGLEEKRFYLQLGEINLGLDIRKIPYLHYDIIEDKKQLILLESIPLPCVLCERTYRDYTYERTKYSQEEAESILNENFKKIIISLQEKGVQIIEKNVKIISNSVSISLCGTLSIEERCNTLYSLEARSEK